MENYVEMSNESLVKAYQEASEKEEKTRILDNLYRKNHGLILKIARRYSKYEEINDLIQESYFGVKVAADLYDQDGGASFSTYVVIWIRQVIRRYIDNCGSVIRCPVHRHGAAINLDKVINRYMMEFNQEPTDKELCHLLGIDQYKLDQLKADKMRLKIRSLDEILPSEEDASLTLGDTIADDHNAMDDLIEVDYNDWLKLILWDEVAKIGPLEHDVLKQRFVYNQTMQEAADKLGIEYMDVKTAEARAFRNLRKNVKLRQFRDSVISHAYIGTGLRNYLYSGTSATERTAIKLYEFNKADINEIERQIEGIDKLLSERKDK